MLTDRPRSIDTCRRYRSRARANSFTASASARSRSAAGLRMPRPPGAARRRGCSSRGRGTRRRPAPRWRGWRWRSGARARRRPPSSRSTQRVSMSASSSVRPKVAVGLRPRAQVHPDRLVAAARGGEELGEQVPAARPPGRPPRPVPAARRPAAIRRPMSSSPAGISQSRGADRMPVLLDQQHPVRVVAGEHRDRAGVVDVFAHDLAVAVVEPVPADVPHRAVVDDLAAADVGPPGVVGQPRRHPEPVPRQAVTASATSNRRLACCRSSAAPIRPRNSGCARFGRERSSGCACVPT